MHPKSLIEIMGGFARERYSGEDPAPGAVMAAERDRVLAGWNDATAAAGPEMLPGVFEARAARIPDAVAVVCGLVPGAS